MVLRSTGRGYCKKMSVKIFEQNFCLGCLRAFKESIILNIKFYLSTRKYYNQTESFISLKESIKFKQKVSFSTKESIIIIQKVLFL